MAAYLQNLPSLNQEHFSQISAQRTSKTNVESPTYIATYETAPAPNQAITSEPCNLLLRYLTQRFEMQHITSGATKGAKRTGTSEEPDRLNKRPTGPPQEEMTM